jgi:hypothetical protein
MEGHLVADINLDSESNIPSKSNWFYAVGDTLFIKSNKEDPWFTHSIPKTAINGLKDPNLELLYFEISSIYICINCYAANEKEWNSWVNFFSKWIESKSNLPKFEDSLDEFYKERKNLDGFVSDITNSIITEGAKWKIPKAQMVEAFLREFCKLNDEMDVLVDKSHQGKKQVLVLEKDLERIKAKCDKVDKLELDNFELFKRVTKTQSALEVRNLLDDEVEQLKIYKEKTQNALKYKDNKLIEMVNNENKLKKDLSVMELRIVETKKIEEKITKEKLEFLGITTKNQQLELCVKLMESTVQEKEKLVVAMKAELRDVKKLKDREKRLSTLVDKYEVQLGIVREEETPITITNTTTGIGGSKTPRSDTRDPNEKSPKLEIVGSPLTLGDKSPTEKKSPLTNMFRMFKKDPNRDSNKEIKELK